MPAESSKTAASVLPEEGDMVLEVMDREWSAMKAYMKKFKEVSQYHLAEDCSKRYPYNYDKNQQNTARRRAMQFTLVGDRLHHTVTGKVKFRAIEEIVRAFFEAHLDYHGNHTSVTPTWNKFCDRHYTRGLFKVIKQWIDQCPTCSK
ncbi:hypothetical protein BC832DRAFT_543622 [Gaertneriomyces semiglobifer]|nr:hypothetical protein BC832DRAFT_543622 [Gaertneriomyces semiglobifer]